MGARYLDPKYSRWISTDPALGEYVPQALVNDDAKKHNQNLPGMGGLFNSVNLSLFHYAGNNPVRYVDPDGRFDTFKLIDQNQPSDSNENSGNIFKALCCYALGTVVFLGTLVEDAATGGIGIADDPASFATAGFFFSCGWELVNGGSSKHQVQSPLGKSPTICSPASPEPDDDGDYYESSLKHHQNARGMSSQEPKNAKEMFDKSVRDPNKPNTRWYRDKNGDFHRFQGSNHKYHWNGSTNTGTRVENVPIELRRSLPIGEF